MDRLGDGVPNGNWTDVSAVAEGGVVRWPQVE
jgi:hypothetical protein